MRLQFFYFYDDPETEERNHDQLVFCWLVTEIPTFVFKPENMKRF